MASQCVFFFRDSDGYGWSTKLFIAGVFDPAVGGPALTAMANALANCTCQSVTLKHIRVASSTKRNPFVFAPNAGAGITGGLSGQQEDADIAFLVRLDAGPTGFNRIFLRGFDRLSVTGEHLTPSAGFTSALNALFSQLISGPWQAVGTLGSPVTPIAIAPNTMNTTPPRGFTFVSADATVSIGDRVRIHHAQIPGYNGIKTITNKSGTAPTVTYSCGGAAPPVNEPGIPYFTKIVTFTQGIGTVEPEGVTRRAPGRPFGLSRGRKPTLYSLRQ